MELWIYREESKVEYEFHTIGKNVKGKNNFYIKKINLTNCSVP